MLSVRLNSDLESQLDFLAMKSGQSKNQLVAAAVEQFLKLQDLGSIPLKQQVQEASSETFTYLREREKEEWFKALRIAEMSREGGIWTAAFNPSGKVTGAIHGRNVVVGHHWSVGQDIQVISKNLSLNTGVSGVGAYQYDLTPFDVWESHMMRCEIKSQ